MKRYSYVSACAAVGAARGARARSVFAPGEKRLCMMPSSFQRRLMHVACQQLWYSRPFGVRSMLLEGKVGLVLGIANKRSLAWGIAQAVSREGARLAVPSQSAWLEENVRELAAG